MAAIDALGRVASAADRSVRARVMDVLSHLADEDGFRVRMALVRALRASEAPEAVEILSRIRMADADGRVRRHALLAMDDLTTAGSTPESVANLKEALSKLEEEHRKLKGMFEEMAAKR